MGKFCVAANCTNRSDNTQNVSFHKFPRKETNADRYHNWIRQVKRTRDKWNGPTSLHTFVCSDHFTPESFEIRPQLKQKLGICSTPAKMLKPDAVPTIFNRSHDGPTIAKRSCTAVEKIQRKRFVNESLNSLEATKETENEADDVGDTANSSQVSASCQTVFIVPKKNTKIVQANIKVGKKKGTQTDKFEYKNTCIQVGNGVIDNLDDSIESNPSSYFDTEDGSLYFPSADSEHEADEFDDVNFDIPLIQPAAESNNSDVLNEPKFIVFWSALQMLLSWIHCPLCQSHEVLTSRCSEGPSMGTLLRVQIFCESCGKTTFWKSQPYINDYPAGNVLLSSAILFSGSVCAKVLALFKHMRLWTIEKTTFFRHQRELLYPAIRSVWDRNQEIIVGLLRARGDGAVLGGDGRADSMGHSAKYGTYTCIELAWNCILDIKIVTSSEVKSSYHMELEGLKRSLDYIKDWLKIEKLVTDRHRQIAKFIRENHGEILHLYDIWHVAKSLGKKLEAASKLKGCESIRPWTQSIVIHLYWSAISSTVGERQEITETWKSFQPYP